ncbi:hypothetical protein BKA69DRAFT_1126038 [Paraphysoderma sedebokerense]|nr:hypothetical protein BKA69DRAFT_1126038 [Paraphysoderma sedebokerense]
MSSDSSFSSLRNNHLIPSLNTLPSEILISSILPNLDPKSLFNLSRTCSLLYHLCNNHIECFIKKKQIKLCTPRKNRTPRKRKSMCGPGSVTPKSNRKTKLFQSPGSQSHDVYEDDERKIKRCRTSPYAGALELRRSSKSSKTPGNATKITPRSSSRKSHTEITTELTDTPSKSVRSCRRRLFGDIDGSQFTGKESKAPKVAFTMPENAPRDILKSSSSLPNSPFSSTAASSYAPIASASIKPMDHNPFSSPIQSSSNNHDPNQCNSSELISNQSNETSVQTAAAPTTTDLLRQTFYKSQISKKYCSMCHYNPSSTTHPFFPSSLPLVPSSPNFFSPSKTSTSVKPKPTICESCFNLYEYQIEFVKELTGGIDTARFVTDVKVVIEVKIRRLKRVVPRADFPIEKGDSVRTGNNDIEGNREKAVTAWIDAHTWAKIVDKYSQFEAALVALHPSYHSYVSSASCRSTLLPGTLDSVSPLGLPQDITKIVGSTPTVILNNPYRSTFSSFSASSSSHPLHASTISGFTSPNTALYYLQQTHSALLSTLYTIPSLRRLPKEFEDTVRTSSNFSASPSRHSNSNDWQSYSGNPHSHSPYKKTLFKEQENAMLTNHEERLQKELTGLPKNERAKIVMWGDMFGSLMKTSNTHLNPTTADTQHRDDAVEGFSRVTTSNDRRRNANQTSEMMHVSDDEL